MKSHHSSSPLLRSPSPSRPHSRSMRLDGILIFFAGLIVGLIFGLYVLKYAPEHCFDVDGFGKLGARFAQDWSLGGSIRRAPIYPFFLGLLYRAFGMGNHVAVVAAQALILGLLCLSVRCLSFSVFQSRALAMGTGLCAVFHPMLFWYVPRLWVELPYALLTIGATFMAIHALKKPTWGRIIVFGASLALATLCKATTLLLPLFLGGFALAGRLIHARAFAHLSLSETLRFAMVPFLAMCMFLAPWTFRNWKVTGRFVAVSGNLPVEFFRGTVFAEHNSFQLKKGIAELWTETQMRENALIEQSGLDPDCILTDISRDDLFAQPMREMIFHRPGLFVAKILKQIPAFWTLGETRAKSAFFLASASILLILGGWGLWKWRMKPDAVVVFGTVVYFNLCYAAILAYARYSMILYPLLLVYAVPRIIDLWQRFSCRQKQDRATSGNMDSLKAP